MSTAKPKSACRRECPAAVQYRRRGACSCSLHLAWRLPPELDGKLGESLGVHFDTVYEYHAFQQSRLVVAPVSVCSHVIAHTFAVGRGFIWRCCHGDVVIAPLKIGWSGR